MKMNVCAQMSALGSPAEVSGVVERVATVRRVIGSERDLVVDFHGRMSKAVARQVLPLLEAYRPLFVEEPVLPEFSRDLRSVVESTTIPIATGERLFSRWDFRDVFPTGIAVAQPESEPRRRHLRGLSHRGHGGDLGRNFGAALSARPAGACCQLAGRLQHPQLPHTGTKRRHSLQPTQ